MPDSVEMDLELILEGLPIEKDEGDICDFTIADQNEAMEAQGVAPSVKSDYIPILGETVTYIVACVLINEYDEVLMMQEAKQSCAGKWYLPAGRMESGENIVQAAAREVLEETGLTIETTTLLLIETAMGSWIRFVLTGKVTGGVLKTPASADHESLQAKWVKNLNELTLRSNDIHLLVEKARLFHESRRMNNRPWHIDILPGLHSHQRLLLRLVVCARKKATNRLHILVSEREAWHLPTCELHPGRSLYSTLRKFMIELFGAEVAEHKPHGLLNVEHDSCNDHKDGACLSILISFRVPVEEIPILAKCVWHEVSKELGDRILHNIVTRNSTIQLNVIR